MAAWWSGRRGSNPPAAAWRATLSPRDARVAEPGRIELPLPEGRRGFQPRALPLRHGSKATLPRGALHPPERNRRRRSVAERPAGVEPAQQPWQGRILPLDHGRKDDRRKMIALQGLPLGIIVRGRSSAEATGVEPARPGGPRISNPFRYRSGTLPAGPTGVEPS